MNASLRRWKIPRNKMVSGTKQDNLLTFDQSGKRWLRKGQFMLDAAGSFEAVDHWYRYVQQHDIRLMLT